MSDEFLKALFGQPLQVIGKWFNSHGTIAWALLFIVLLLWLVPKLFDSVDIWKARVLWPVAKWLKFRGLVNAATRYDLRGHVNRAVGKIAKELPNGWVSELDIRWVNNETRDQFFANNKIVVCVRPLKEQHDNFVTVIHLFLKQALFGNVKLVVPELQRTAAILYFGDRIATARGEATAKAFGERIFEPAIDGKKKVLDYYQRYTELDGTGFFSGPYVREVQHVATEVRATRFRENMAAEMNEALTHLEEFCNAYKKSQLEQTPIQDCAWQRSGIMTKYGLLLVAHPGKAAFEGAAGYIS